MKVKFYFQFWMLIHLISVVMSDLDSLELTDLSTESSTDVTTPNIRVKDITINKSEECLDSETCLQSSITAVPSRPSPFSEFSIDDSQGFTTSYIGSPITPQPSLISRTFLKTSINSPSIKYESPQLIENILDLSNKSDRPVPIPRMISPNLTVKKISSPSLNQSSVLSSQIPEQVDVNTYQEISFTSEDPSSTEDVSDTYTTFPWRYVNPTRTVFEDLEETSEEQSEISVEVPEALAFELIYDEPSVTQIYNVGYQIESVVSPSVQDYTSLVNSMNQDTASYEFTRNLKTSKTTSSIQDARSFLVSSQYPGVTSVSLKPEFHFAKKEEIIDVSYFTNSFGNESPTPKMKTIPKPEVTQISGNVNGIESVSDTYSRNYTSSVNSLNKFIPTMYNLESDLQSSVYNLESDLQSTMSTNDQQPISSTSIFISPYYEEISRSSKPIYTVTKKVEILGNVLSYFTNLFGSEENSTPSMKTKPKPQRKKYSLISNLVKFKQSIEPTSPSSENENLATNSLMESLYSQDSNPESEIKLSNEVITFAAKKIGFSITTKQELIQSTPMLNSPVEYAKSLTPTLSHTDSIISSVLFPLESRDESSNAITADKNCDTKQTLDPKGVDEKKLDQTTMEILQDNMLLLLIIGAVIIQIQIVIGLLVIWKCLYNKLLRFVRNISLGNREEFSNVVNFKNSLRLEEGVGKEM